MSIRAKLLAASVVLIASVVVTSGVLLETRLRPDLVRLGQPLGAIEETIGELRALLLLAGLIGLAVALVMSGLASRLMTRALRSLVDDAVAVVRGRQKAGETKAHAEEIGQLAGSFHVIASELQKAVGDLAGERDRLETILASMHEGVIAVDKAGRLVLANRAAKGLVGLDEPHLGKLLLEVVRVPALAEIAAESRAGRDAVREFEIARPVARQILAHAAPLRSVGGGVVVMHDVTEIRRLERMRRDFVANVSHELRTPIAVIQANAETLLGGALTDSAHAQRFLDGIHRNAERLSQLIADLLDLSRIEAGKLDMKLESVDLAEAVHGAVEGLRARSDEYEVTVENAVDAKITVRADAGALGQILTNYLDNAIKHAREGGRVRVAARAIGARVRIEVEDDGPGLEPHHRARVFERFYRADPARGRSIGGTGLGLSIVKHLTEAMQGQVGVEPADGRGSRFWVALPAGPAAGAQSAEGASSSGAKR